MVDIVTSKNNGCQFPDHYGHLTYVYSKPILQPLHNLGISPNMITTLRLLITILILYLLWNQKYVLWTIPLYVLVYYLDAVDGSLARVYNQGTIFGKYYDGIVDAIGYIGIALIILYYLPSDIIIYYVILVIFCLLYNKYGLTTRPDGCLEPNKLHYLTGQLVIIIIGIILIHANSKHFCSLSAA